jgi:hypothetical protein
MAKKDEEWLVTHLVTAERIPPNNDDEWGFWDYVGVGVVIVVVLAIIHACAG